MFIIRDSFALNDGGYFVFKTSDFLGLKLDKRGRHRPMAKEGTYTITTRHLN